MNISKLKTPNANRVSLNRIQILTMDIETMEWNGKQIPIAISLAYYKNNVFTNPDYLDTFFVLIDKDLLLEYGETLSVKDLWVRFFELFDAKQFNDSFYKSKDKLTIFMHNLGSFDGLFLIKGLLLNNICDYHKVHSLLDQQKEFIQIETEINNIKIVWKDSHRIFPVSLNSLCEVFKVSGKTSKYNLDYNNIDLFNKPDLLEEFKKYSLTDSVALLEALIKAQDIYIKNFSVDIASVLSTSTLSLKIFRTSFLTKDIPCLNNNLDQFIRQSYYGGATDYYQMYGENMNYYDVNSLYPHAMLNPMPFDLIKYYSNMTNINLMDVFGFFLADIECPPNIKYPLIPYRDLNVKGTGVIYPTGRWTGVYFSELLKIASLNGYKIKLLSGYTFSQEFLFNKYVQHIYETKKISNGAERFIAKMHLNQLYGYFGRSLKVFQTENLNRQELKDKLTLNIVHNLLQISPDLFIALIANNLNEDVIKELNIKLNKNFNLNRKKIRSNVAIASAVTSYAQIEMIKLKLLCVELGINILYSDTDSMITDRPLPSYLIGKDLGLLKDELDGGIITRGYFLGVKNYGYEYKDKQGNLHNKSVFSGVERDSLNFNEIIKLSLGETLLKDTKPRFIRDFSDFSLKIKPNKMKIQKSNAKQLVNNKYIPLHINNFNKLKPYSFVSEIVKKLKQIFKLF